jgi:hypothetical protein
VRCEENKKEDLYHSKNTVIKVSSFHMAPGGNAVMTRQCSGGHPPFTPFYLGSSIKEKGKKVKKKLVEPLLKTF